MLYPDVKRLLERKMTFSCYHVQSRESLGFSPGMYSRFKYGSKDAAREMGRDLANKFIMSDQFKEYCKMYKHRRIVILPSPYNFIPTATFALKDYFIPVLNRRLAELHLPPVQEAKIYRAHSYNEDYGAMSAEDRKVAIGSESFHTDVEFLKDKFAIFLDDIRITGSHEERINEMIQRLDMTNIESNIELMYMYYAELKNSSEDPKVENYLNYYDIKDLLCINKIIKNETFLFNTRNTKYILGRTEQEFNNFINYQSDTFRETLYHYAIGNSYHLCEEFRTNFSTLQKSIS